MAKIFGLADQRSQAEMAKVNAVRFDPHIDRNLLRDPDRMIHVFSTSKRSFKIDRPPLWLKLVLQACGPDDRYVAVVHIPDPLMQVVHDTERARRRGEANDGMLCAVELLNPNNPTYNPDFVAPPEVEAELSLSKGCNLFAQGLFLSLHDPPLEEEILAAEARKARRYRELIAHADSLEQTNRKELEDFIKGEDGTDLRMALDFYGEQRSYHKPMIASKLCPNCGEAIKSGIAFHKNESLGVICVLDWEKAVRAGVKTKLDVPEDLRWWTDDAAPADPKPATKRRR